MTYKHSLSFSVIVPTLNSEDTLDRTLQSIYSQTYKPLEVIVVDGFSTDRSSEIFESSKRKSDCLVTAPRSGPYAAMNAGIQIARGEIVAILNSDDHWASTEVLRLVNDTFSSNDTRIGIVHGDIQVQERDGGIAGIVKPARGWEYYCGLGLPFCHPATFIRRDCYLMYGTYNWISFPCQADRELGFRLGRVKVRSVYLPEVLTVFCTGGLSSSSYDKNETLKVIKSFPLQRRLIARILAMLTALHPKYYSGYSESNLGSLVYEFLLGFPKRMIEGVANL